MNAAAPYGPIALPAPNALLQVGPTIADVALSLVHPMPWLGSRSR